MPGLSIHMQRAGALRSGLPAEARADGVFLVAVAVHLQLAVQAPVLVQLDLATQAAVPLAFRIDAVLLRIIFVTDQAVDFGVRAEGGADTGFSAVAVEVQAVLRVELLVGDAGNEVARRGDFNVVAGTDLPLVNLQVGVVDLLAAVFTEGMEVRQEAIGTLDAPTVGLDAVDVGLGVVGFSVVVGQVLGGRGGERQGGGQGQCNQRSLHGGTPFLMVSSGVADLPVRRKCKFSVIRHNAP